jgi:metal-responsive CopG/Arc/MetJ family transcriptional regulator
MAVQRTHVVLSSDLVEEIDRIVGRRKRSEFIAEAAARELLRQRQMQALERADGAWRADDHPEIRSAALHVRRLRRDNERRIERLHRAS